MTTQHRRSIRLHDYDYTQNGAYFVTVCAHEKRCVFGDVVDGEMVVNAWGRVVIEEWQQTAILRPNVELDAFVVMPNHMHGVIMIVDDGFSVGRNALRPGITPNTNNPAKWVEDTLYKKQP